MKKFISIALLLTVSKLSMASTVIEIIPPENTFGTNSRYESPFKEVTSDSIEPGDDLPSGSIKITSTDNERFRVYVQLETTASLGDEGPHLDLEDWKHCVTPRLALEHLPTGEFVIPTLYTIDTDCFPDYSLDEARSAVDKQGGERWTSVFDRSVSAGYDPLSIGLSTVRFVIEKYMDGKWQKVTDLEIAIPLGC